MKNKYVQIFQRRNNCFKIYNIIVTKAPVLSPQDNPTVVVEDLRLCTVKHCEDIERRFCFEVVSPTK